jgi:transposase-like protein
MTMPTITLIESPECPYDGRNQTVDHLLYDCPKLQMERVKLINNTSNQDKWPVNKRDLVKKHIKHFKQFANSIDFEKL